jgi:hypothetical protein
MKVAIASDHARGVLPSLPLIFDSLRPRRREAPKGAN